jgi:hypothetical protein
MPLLDPCRLLSATACVYSKVECLLHVASLEYRLDLPPFGSPTLVSNLTYVLPQFPIHRRRDNQADKQGVDDGLPRDSLLRSKQSWSARPQEDNHPQVNSSRRDCDGPPASGKLVDSIATCKGWTHLARARRGSTLSWKWHHRLHLISKLRSERCRSPVQPPFPAHAYGRVSSRGSRSRRGS